MSKMENTFMWTKDKSEINELKNRIIELENENAQLKLGGSNE